MEYVFKGITVYRVLFFEGGGGGEGGKVSEARTTRAVTEFPFRRSAFRYVVALSIISRLNQVCSRIYSKDESRAAVCARFAPVSIRRYRTPRR